MLKDDAIRAGLLQPTKDDIKRMNLKQSDLEKIKGKLKKGKK